MRKKCCNITKTNRLKNLDLTKPDQTPHRPAAEKLALSAGL